MTEYPPHMESMLRSFVERVDIIHNLGMYKTVTYSFCPELLSDLSVKYKIPSDEIHRMIGKAVFEAQPL
jgi:hypothetical protein